MQFYAYFSSKLKFFGFLKSLKFVSFFLINSINTGFYYFGPYSDIAFINNELL